MEFDIQLKSVQEVLSFVALATSRPFRVSVGNQAHQVNGKSFMEMFCLNLKSPVTVHVDCTEEEFLQFRQDADRFLVNH